MKPTDVEQWCASVIDELKRGKRVEDDRVELKRELPRGDATGIARRIAGHANQARSDRILWLIGAVEDPKPSFIRSVPRERDAAEWWVPVEARFDDVAPSPTMVRIAVDGERSVLGIGFDTARPPYVVKTGLDVQSREVPWREGTRIRTANRFDLLRLLAPVSARPEIAEMGSFVSLSPRSSRESETDKTSPWDWQGELGLYIDCELPLILPDHRCHAAFVTRSRRIELGITPYAGAVRGFVGSNHVPAGRLAERGDGQLLLNASAAVTFHVFGKAELAVIRALKQTRRASIEVEFETAGLDRMRFEHTIEMVQAGRSPDSRRLTWEST